MQNENIVSSFTKTKIEIFTTERFNKDIKKYENVVSDFIKIFYRDLSSYGEEILKKFNFKKMQGVGTFKIYSKIKGHRIHLTFGSQVENLKNTHPNAIVLFAYSREHDRQGQDAKLKSQNLDFAKTNILEFNSFSVSESSEKVSENEFEKLYYPALKSKFLFPLLSEEQKMLVQKNDSVLIQGVAGSGKTNICIDKLLQLSENLHLTEKVLFSTFSDSLLFETKEKIISYANELNHLIESYKLSPEKFAKELNCYKPFLKFNFDNLSTEESVAKLIRCQDFLVNNIDFLRIPDIYKLFNKSKFNYATKNYFIEEYLNTNCGGNYNLFNQCQKLKIQDENLFKELYGLIFGAVNSQTFSKDKCIISKEEYFQRRKEFSQSDCAVIYKIAEDYLQFLNSQNAKDENIMAFEMQKANFQKNEYSVGVLDEVQDFSEQALVFLKNISKKLFCVGDPNQMVNPTYFRFEFLKNLLSKTTLFQTPTEVLNVNYRSSKEIGDFIEKLMLINKEYLGNWSFAISGIYKDTTAKSVVAFTDNAEFVKSLSLLSFDNYCIIVSSAVEKQKLKEQTNAVVLTVSEAKGLEYDCVVLFNVLTAFNSDWQNLNNKRKNKTFSTKSADENSYYRYLYNLFYVGVTRAKQNLVIVETEMNKMFKPLFQTGVKHITKNTTQEEINEVLELKNLSVDEILERVEVAIKERVFDVAYQNANKIKEFYPTLTERINIYYDLGENYDYLEAGDRFLDAGFIDDAKKQYLKSSDPSIKQIYQFLDSDFALNKEMGKTYTNVKSAVLRKIILQAFKRENSEIKTSNEQISNKLGELKIWKK